MATGLWTAGRWRIGDPLGRQQDLEQIANFQEFRTRGCRS
jgi:hypothetical protein